MKVYGELEYAIMQQIAAATTTPAIAGRFYADITSTSKAIPRFYNGSNWLQILTGQSASLVSQNSGSAVTVDWSTGVNQQVILTGNCLISFSNPQAGQVHTLVITQGSSTGFSPAYCYALNMTDQDPGRKSYQPLYPPQAGESQFYQWFYSSAVKAAYATLPNANFAPLVLPGSATLASDISPTGKNVTICNSTSPYTFTYQINDSSIIPQFGAKAIVTNSTAAAAVVQCAYAPDGNSFFTIGATTPFIQGWFMSQETPASAAWANPGSLPITAGTCLAIHPTCSFLSVGFTGAGLCWTYPYNASGTAGYGTKLAAPATAFAAAPYGLAFSPQGDYLAVASGTTPFIQVYAFTSTPGAGALGAVSSNPGALPANGPSANGGKQIAWRPQGDYIAMVTGTITPYIYVVPFNRATGAFGTALTITALSGAAKCVAWTPDGNYLLVGTGTSPYLYIYSFASGVLTAVTFDGAQTFQAINDIIISRSGDYAILCYNATNYMTGIVLPNMQKNYLRIASG